MEVRVLQIIGTQDDHDIHVILDLILVLNLQHTIYLISISTVVLTLFYVSAGMCQATPPENKHTQKTAGVNVGVTPSPLWQKRTFCRFFLEYRIFFFILKETVFVWFEMDPRIAQKTNCLGLWKLQNDEFKGSDQITQRTCWQTWIKLDLDYLYLFCF